jgi:tripartite-type tricarboxylate transporter receptor subunit TctC
MRLALNKVVATGGVALPRGDEMIVNRWTRRLAMACLIAPALSGVAMAQTTPASFYAGKTVSIIVGFGSGGGYDLYARLLSRYLGAHIPGHPNVIVQNMEGAGGVRAANYVYSIAPKDGTVIAGVNQGAPLFKLLGGKDAQYDPAKFNWIGSMAWSNNTVYVWHTSGIRTIEDAKGREVAMAGSGVISDANIYPAVLNALVGTKFKVINGYAGTNESNLALVSNEEDRQIASLVTLPVAIGYNYWMAPGVPAERTEILRAAFIDTMADPQFLAEAAKMSFDIRPKTGAQLEKLIRDASTIPKPVLDRAAKILGW